MPRPFDTPFQLSTTNDGHVNYSIKASQTFNLDTPSSILIELQVSPDGVNGWTTKARWSKAVSIAGLGLGQLVKLTLLDEDYANISTHVPYGWYVRIKSDQTALVGTLTMEVEDETIYPRTWPDLHVDWTTVRDVTTAPETTSHKSGDIQPAFSPLGHPSNKLVKL